MATQRPFRLTVTLDLPRPILDGLKRDAKAAKLPLEQLIAQRLGAPSDAPAPRRAGPCRHTRTVAEGKIEGMRKCVDCGARLT